MRLPAGLADHVADLLPHRCLGDEIDVGVGIGLPALAFEDTAGLAAAGALGDVLIDLAVFVRPGPEALDRGHDHLRIDAVDLLPGKAHAIEHAGAKVLHQHVAGLDQRGEDFLALRVLGVERDRTLVVVQHGEIQAVHVRNVLQLPARDVADAGTLDLDHVGAEPGQQLRAGRSRLNVGEIENSNARKRLCHYLAPYCVCLHLQGVTGLTAYFFFKTLCGLRLPMRPLSEPAAGSITALIKVGLPESIAALTARFSSSGEVAWTPTPPNASIILS